MNGNVETDLYANANNGNENAPMKPINLNYNLYYSFVAKNYKELSTLLHNPNTSLTWQNDAGNTVIHAVCAQGDYKTLQFMLSSGKTVDFSIRNKDGETPLMVAIRKNKPNIFNYLFGIPILTDEMLGISGALLQLACITHNKDIAHILYARTPSIVNSVDEHGRTTLHTMCILGDIDMAGMLLSFPQTDPNARTTLGETPFLLAVRHNHISLVSHMLTIASIDANAANAAMNTPLMIACYRENEEMIRLLLGSGRLTADDIYAIIALDNVVKGVPKSEGIETVIFFSNSVNNLLVEYANSVGIAAARPKIKQKFTKLRIGVKHNVNTSTTYASKSHPSCLTDVDLQNLYTRLRIPPRTAILQQDSLFVSFNDAGVGISHHGAFLERILTPEPFMGTISVDFTGIGGEMHICAYLFMHNTLFILDTAPARDVVKNKDAIINYIQAEAGTTVGIVDVAGGIQRTVTYSIDLQTAEGTGYCTMWTAAFIERIANLIPALVTANNSQQYSIFKGVYDEFLARPTYGYNFYQELAGRVGGARATRRIHRR